MILLIQGTHKKRRYSKEEISSLKSIIIKKVNKRSYNIRILKVITILLASALFTVGFANRDNFAPENLVGFIQDKFARLGEGKGYPAEIKGKKVCAKNFDIFNKDSSFVSDTSFVCLNSTAKEVACRQHSFENPVYKVAGSRALIFDSYGRGYEIDRKCRNIKRGEMENSILTGAIAENGTFGFVVQSKGFLGELSVFAPNGKDIYYRFYFADHYISSMAFSTNGKSVAVIGLSAQDGEMISALYVFDYKNEHAKFKINYENSMLMGVEYLANGNIVVLGDNIISFVNSKTGKQVDFKYDNRTVTAFDISKNSGAAISLSFSEGGDESEIILFDKNGNVMKKINTNVNIKSISLEKGRIAALSADKAFLYNGSGNLLKQIDVDADAKEIKLFSSRNAYVLGLTKINKIKF